MKKKNNKYNKKLTKNEETAKHLNEMTKPFQKIIKDVPTK